jgi:hypothetical protein
MKQVFILALLTVWMFSCNDSPETISDSVSGDTPIIDTVIPQQTDTVAKAADTVPAEPTFPVGFKVQFTRAYCGGARPSEEIVADYNSPKALTNSTLKLKNHFTGKEYFLNTGSGGSGTVDLEEGKYDVFFTEKIDAGLSTGFDPKCDLWQDQLLQTIKVSAASPQSSINVHFICNPCDETMKRRQ